MEVLMKPMSTIKQYVRSKQVQTNKANHSAAIVAQLTAQINSSGGAKYTLDDFLPYPQASIRELGLDVCVLGTVLTTIEILPIGLRSLINAPELLSKLSASFYWRSGGFIY